jgi:DNA-binding winged helix-turn-helix (wHTH) protein
MAAVVESDRVGEFGSADILMFEGFRLDRTGGVLYRLDRGTSGVPVVLGARTVALLGLLAGRQGEVVSKDEIIKAVWSGRVVEEANLNVQVSKLRQILDQNRAEDSCIQTLPGRGYCFVAPVIRVGDAQPTSPIIPEISSSPQQRLSIVVLPFENLSRDQDEQYFADGITEDLTTNLSRFTNMLVIRVIQRSLIGTSRSTRGKSVMNWVYITCWKEAFADRPSGCASMLN